MMGKSKLDSIETLLSKVLIDMEISHEEFNAIIREKKIWENERNFEKYKWKTRKYEIEKCEFKKITSLSTCDWLKITKHFTRSKKFISFFVYMKCI